MALTRGAKGDADQRLWVGVGRERVLPGGARSSTTWRGKGKGGAGEADSRALGVGVFVSLPPVHGAEHRGQDLRLTWEKGQVERWWLLRELAPSARHCSGRSQATIEKGMKDGRGREKRGESIGGSHPR